MRDDFIKNSKSPGATLDELQEFHLGTYVLIHHLNVTSATLYVVSTSRSLNMPWALPSKQWCLFCAPLTRVASHSFRYKHSVVHLKAALSRIVSVSRRVHVAGALMCTASQTLILVSSSAASRMHLSEFDLFKYTG